MPTTFQKLAFRPGISKDNTNYANEGGFYSCNNVRFRSGSAEKIGGWTKLSSATYLGTCSLLHNWVSNSGNNYAAIFTNYKAYVELGGTFYDITPIRKTTSPDATANPVATLINTKILTITDTAHGALVNDFVTISSATGVTIGGVPIAEINAEHQITEVLTPNTYTITVTTTATSTTTGGGAGVVLAYQDHVGLDTNIGGNGWGAGPYCSSYTTTLTDPFTAAGAGVSTLTVTHNAHPLSTGDYVYFSSIASDPCGIPKYVLHKAFQITKTGANTYTISTIIGAFTYLTTGGAASGGSVTLVYTTTTPRYWGYGDTTSSIPLPMRIWSADNFGEDLVFCYRGGKLMHWVAATGVGVRAVYVVDEGSASDVPTVVNGVMVTEQRQVVVWGSNPIGSIVLDPLFVRWSVSESVVNWTPTATNDAGGYKLSSGSTILAGKKGKGEVLFWSNSDLYTMQYLGGDLIYGFQFAAHNISLVSPQAIATANNTTYWMGIDKFYVYTGKVDTMPCTLRQWVFGNFETDQSWQALGGTNEGFNEIIWFYPSNGVILNDSYVIYNYMENIWYYGSMARSAWLDSPLRNYPMAATSDYIVYHEFGINDENGNGIDAFIESSDFDITDGYQFAFIRRFIPDINFTGSLNIALIPAEVVVTLKARDAPGQGFSVNQTNNLNVQTVSATVDQFTDQIQTRIRGRQAAIRIESTAANVQWQLGNPRIEWQPDGRR